MLYFMVTGNLNVIFSTHFSDVSDVVGPVLVFGLLPLWSVFGLEGLGLEGLVFGLEGVVYVFISIAGL